MKKDKKILTKFKSNGVVLGQTEVTLGGKRLAPDR